MEWIDLRNLHLLPGPLSSSNNIPQNMGDSWDTEQIPKRPSTITASWTTYWVFCLFVFTKLRYASWTSYWVFGKDMPKKVVYSWPVEWKQALACTNEVWFFFVLTWCLAHSDHQCLFGPQHKWLHQAVLCNRECQKKKSLELSTGPTV